MNNPHIIAWRNSLKRVLYYFNLEKNSKTFDILGYSSDDFKDYISDLFLDGMDWSNWGEWHVDHIKPVSKFDKELTTDVSIVNSLSNLQPLWASDNIRKGNKY